MSRVLLILGLAGCGSTPGANDAGPPTDALDGVDAIDAVTNPSPCHAVQVAASTAHSCARMQNGDVWCWGKNGQGEVGNPPQLSCATACNPTAEKIDMPPALDLGLGDQHSCAVTETETYCFGANAAGQFGNAGSDSSVPIAIAERAGARRIVAGSTHTCSLHDDRVLCSGGNANHEVGDGTTTPRDLPVTTVPSGAIAIGSGHEHACMIDDGLVYCWGSNAGAQLAPAAGDFTVPTVIAGVGTATGVTGGRAHTCVVLQTGEVRCWGTNTSSQLGTGDTTAQPQHVTPQVAGITAVSAGGDHTCALAAGGTVYCWGEGYTPTPAAVTLPAAATSIASGGDHDCFALVDGSVWCTGANSSGQLGTGTTQDAAAPVRVGLCP